MPRNLHVLRQVGLRAALAALSAVGIVVVLHAMLRAAPGNAADLLATTPAMRAQLSAAWGLDASLPVAVWRTLGGHLGESLVLRPGIPVTTIILQRGITSLPLLLAATALGPVLAYLLGTRSRPRWMLGLGLSSLPAFLLAFIILTSINELTFGAMTAGWLDRPSWFSLPDTPSMFRNALAVTILTVSGGRLTGHAAAVRATAEGIDRSPAMDALRARAQPTAAARWAGVLPVLISIPGHSIAATLGALVVVEKVFLLPGAGAAFWDAVVQRDLTVALGLGMVAGLVAVGLRLVADLGQVWADPRRRGLP